MRKAAAVLVLLASLTMAVLGVWAVIDMALDLRKYGEPISLVLLAVFAVVCASIAMVLQSIPVALRIGWPEER